VPVKGEGHPGPKRTGAAARQLISQQPEHHRSTAGWQDLARNAAVADAAMAMLSLHAMTRSHQAAHQQLAELVSRGRADGSFRADLPGGWLVSACLALFHACAAEVGAGRLEAADADRVLTATIRSLLTGGTR
jgi:hypothetical protein